MGIIVNLDINNPIPIQIQPKMIFKYSTLNLFWVRILKKSKFSKTRDMLRKVGSLIIGTSIMQGSFHNSMLRELVDKILKFIFQSIDRPANRFEKPRRVRGLVHVPDIPAFILILENINLNFVFRIQNVKDIF